jgi:L-lactate dehydrogenase complex protein LldF
VTRDFRRDVQRALDHPHLADALGRFSESYVISRAQAYEGIDFEALRDRIATIKAEAASHLDELADLFAERATARGAKVFRASNPDEVKKYILDLCQDRGVKRIVKSKSMATEEIDLNAHLEAAGIHVRETDLGEWIIQLCGDRPSHMVLPAIHLTKEEVAEIFSHEVGERIQSDIPRLVKVARRELRQEFLEADLGISGANIAVAETGSVVIVTNEGDGRLVTTLPRTHVVVVGLEKLVAKLGDIAPILTALPRSATAQLLTSYVSIITGPAPGTDGVPKDLHIVLMDNRRTEMAADPIFREALQCIRCASCLNVCPVYRLVGGHVFGYVYTGGIGTILTAWFNEFQKSESIQGLCLQCGRCRQVCPARIDVPKLILELRRRLVTIQGLGVRQRAAYRIVNNRPLFHALLRTASKAQGPMAKDGFIRHLPLFLSEATATRSLPAIARRPLRDVFREIEQPRSGQKAAFFAGCLIDFVYPEMGLAVIRVLNRAGIEVKFPEGQTCCGAPARFAGAPDAAERSVKDNLEALTAEPVDWIVSACPTCTAGLKNEFARYAGEGKWPDLARRVSERTIDFSSLVKRLMDEGRLKLEPDEKTGLVTYHDSCHLKRTLGAEGPPREVLAGAGFELREMFESDTCCGMGGLYMLKQPEISQKILRRKLDNIHQTEAGVVAVDCPGCILQLRGGLDRQSKDNRIKVFHTAELLADLLEIKEKEFP